MFGALAQLVERLLCKQDVNGSNPLGSTKRIDEQADLIGKPLAFPSNRTHASSEAFTSFREIISVVGCTRVGVQWSTILRDWKPTAALSKSSTLTKSLLMQWRE